MFNLLPRDTGRLRYAQNASVIQVKKGGGADEAGAGQVSRMSLPAKTMWGGLWPTVAPVFLSTNDAEEPSNFAAQVNIVHYYTAPSEQPERYCAPISLLSASAVLGNREISRGGRVRELFDSARGILQRGKYVLRK